MNKPLDGQEKSVLDNVPGIENGHGKTMLYVGANRYRAYLFNMFRGFGYEIDILEIFHENVEIIKKSGRWDFNEIIEGDIRKIKQLKDYDVICWWHGPEHVEKEEFLNLVEVFDKKFDIIIVGGPLNDTIGQGPEYGNVHETHLWVIQLEDLVNVGFDTVVVKRKNTDHVTAWKRGNKNVT